MCDFVCDIFRRKIFRFHRFDCWYLFKCRLSGPKRVCDLCQAMSVLKDSYLNISCSEHVLTRSWLEWPFPDRKINATNNYAHLHWIIYGGAGNRLKDISLKRSAIKTWEIKINSKNYGAEVKNKQTVFTRFALIRVI